MSRATSLQIVINKRDKEGRIGMTSDHTYAHSNGSLTVGLFVNAYFATFMHGSIPISETQ